MQTDVKPLSNTAAIEAGDAGGVSGNEHRHWFVAIVNNNSEKKHANIISNEGYEVFLPVQDEERMLRDGTTKTFGRVLIPSTVFVRCTETERISLLKRQMANRFMVDRTKTAKNGKHPIATIPNQQIESFKIFLRQAQGFVDISPVPYKTGEPVKIIGGKFKGITGNVLQYTEGKAKLVVCLGILGCIKLNIENKYVTRV